MPWRSAASFAVSSSDSDAIWIARGSMSTPNRLFSRMAAGMSTGSATEGSAGQPSWPACSISSRYMRWKSPNAYCPKCIVPQAGSISVMSQARLYASTSPVSVGRWKRIFSPVRGTR